MLVVMWVSVVFVTFWHSWLWRAPQGGKVFEHQGDKEAEGKKGFSAQYTYLALQDWSTF
jgi:hypothetical protein